MKETDQQPEDRWLERNLCEPVSSRLQTARFGDDDDDDEVPRDPRKIFPRRLSTEKGQVSELNQFEAPLWIENDSEAIKPKIEEIENLLYGGRLPDPEKGTRKARLMRVPPLRG